MNARSAARAHHRRKNICLTLFLAISLVVGSAQFVLASEATQAPPTGGHTATTPGSGGSGGSSAGSSSGGQSHVTPIQQSGGHDGSGIGGGGTSSGTPADTSSSFNAAKVARQHERNAARKVAQRQKQRTKPGESCGGYCVDGHKVTICHATDSYSNPYTNPTVDIASAGGHAGHLQGGHEDHTGPLFDPNGPPKWGDIIPPFTYDNGDVHTSFPGLNWSAAGQDIYNAGCGAPTHPSVQVTKTCPESASIGDDITYSITIKNTGDEKLVGISVNDPLLGGSLSGFPSSLDAGDSSTKTFHYTVQANDPDPLENSVSVDATGDISGADVSDSDACNTNIQHHPAIQVTKTCPESASIGDQITYTITVKNTGDETLNNIVVQDSLLGDLSGQFPEELTPGQSATHDFTYTVKADDPDPLPNSVTASGDGADSGQHVSDDDACNTDISHHPAISVTKSCPETASIGDQITYTITVKNTGDETLNNIVVQDSLLGDLSGQFPEELTPGQSATHNFTYTVKADDPDPLPNSVTASGTGADSGKNVSDDDSCSTDITHQGGIDVTKSCPETASIGDQITYTITVKNTGNETLNNIVVQDSLLGDLSGQFPEELTPGQSATHDFTYTVKADDPDPLPNSVTASGVGADSEKTVTDEDSCSTDIQHHPGISVTKTCPEVANEGSEITYTITVKNTGDETLNNIVVQDSLLGDLSGQFPEELTPGQSATHQFTYTVPKGIDKVHNEVDVSGIGADSGATASDSATCDTTVIQHHPGISVTKSCPETASIGDEITYTIKIENTGDETLNNIVVQDSLLGDLSGQFPEELTPGQSATHDFTYTVKADDPNPLPNSVTASGTGAISGDQATDEDACQTNIQHHPAISVTKTCPESAKVGDEITYTITVKNTGDETLNNIVVQDSLLGDLSGQFPEELTPGQSATHDFTYTVQQDDPDPLPNSVSATGTGALSQQQVTDSDECSTDIIPPVEHHPAISVTKSCPETAKVGDEITYTITITNTGDEEIQDVVVNDSLLGNLSGQFPEFLNVGDSATREFTYTVQQDDPDPLPNSVTVTGLGVPSETQVSDSDSCSTDIQQGNPAINLEKDGPATVHVGDTITYTFTVTNPGDVPLHNVAVTDPRCDDTPAITDKMNDNGDGLLDPGEVWIYSCDHLVTVEDPDPIPNTAVATGTDPGDTVVTDDGSHSVDIIHPAIQIVKTVNPISGAPGDVVTYSFEVTNTGDTPLYNVSVDDDHLGHIGDIAFLGVGDVTLLTHDFTLGLVAVHNVATATGTDELGKSVSDTDDADVTVVLPHVIHHHHNNPHNGPPNVEGGTLPFTGGQFLVLALQVLALLALGALLLFFGRRKRGTQGA